MVERPFDTNFRCRENEPAREPMLALCGFDSNPVRRDLAGAQFRRVVESGLGSTIDNFDTLSVHALPNPRSPEELWPDLSREDTEKRAKERERMARENPAYLSMEHDESGRIELAGKSIAVPFVGAAAASLAVAEVLRLLHGGPVYTDLKLSLAMPNRCAALSRGLYATTDLIGLAYAAAARNRAPVHTSFIG